MNIRMLIIMSILSLLSEVGGQNIFPVLGGQRAGTSVLTFLNIGVSASAVGMGESVVALEQNAASMYYNPGIIAQLGPMEMTASHVRWPADIYYDFFAVSKKVYQRHYLGVTAGILHMAPMQETTEYLPHGTGKYFVFQNTVIGLVYGVKMTDRFSFGITGKLVSENLAGNIMQVALLDMGTFYWTGFKSLRFSASLSHFGGQAKPDGTYEKRTLNPDTGEESIIETEFEPFSPPTVFRVGVAMNVFETKVQTITATIQLNHPVDNAENISAGIEYSVIDMIFLRGGFNLNESDEFEKKYSFGVGLNIPLGLFNLTVDYAYTNFIHLTDPNRFTIGLSMK